MQEAIVQASSVSGISSRWVRVFPKFCSKHHMQEGIVQASSVSAISSRMAGAGMSHNHKGQEEGVYPPNNFSWIVKEELAAMAWPRMPSNLRFLEKQGIKHLVTLSPEMKPPIHTFAELKWTEIPVEEFCSPSVTQIKEFIDICQKSKTKNESVGVHCRMGLGRTGVMAACFFVHFYGQSPEQAITNVRLLRPGSVETYEQEKAVFRYHDYLRSL